MIVIKKLHDDIGDTGDIANIANIASAKFSCIPVLFIGSPMQNVILFASGRAEARVAFMPPAASDATALLKAESLVIS